jgi:hypothetical protein|tara:strand:+ start:157 stop:657 length:501 start_codon:yes stop_codon:yes gene_type:complete
MVKNTKGGKGSRSMARKSLGIGMGEERRTRYSCDPLEVYGIVTRLYGHGRCEVTDVEGEAYLMQIRKKYSGRGRRGNEVKVGVWVLCGKRSWESIQKTVDLLCVYDEREVLDLKSIGVKLGEEEKVVNEEDEGWVYGEEEEEMEELEVEKNVEVMECTAEVNIDDI